MLSWDKVESVLARFRGEIEQVPPMHSAIKLGGQRLYKLAHKGLVVERRARIVTIHRLRLLEVSGAETMREKVHGSSRSIFFVRLTSYFDSSSSQSFSRQIAP